MALLLPVFLLAIAIGDKPAELRSGCSGDSDVVARLDAGTKVDVRFAVWGESVPCYKIAAQAHGKTVEGYVPAAALAGLDEFDKVRRDGTWLDITQVMGAVNAAQRPNFTVNPGAGASPLVIQATELIETSEPAKALELLESGLRKQKRDPTLLTMAGVAAWRSDDAHKALDYWKQSLDLQPNPDLERLYHRVEREAASDGSSEKLYGLRVALRYDPRTVPAETARAMVAMLDEEYSRISERLGCSSEERIVAIIQSRDAYLKSTDAAEWSGGQYDGRIRIPFLPGTTQESEIRRVLAHEAVHACLANLGRFPAWLHEGLAQKLSGESLSPEAWREIHQMARAKALPRLANLRQDWSRMSPQHAALAYRLSLAAVEVFLENYKEYGLRNLVRNPERLAQITADLDRRLGL